MNFIDKALLSNVALCFTLTACGGGGSDSPADNSEGKADTAPTLSLAQPWAEDGSTVLSGQQELVLNFSEAMQTNTLSLGGDMVPDCQDETDEYACLNQTWSVDEKTLTLSPKEGFYWYSDKRNFEISIIGDGTLGLNQSYTATILPVFENHQAADIVIGQNSFSNDYESTNDRGLYHPTGLNLIEDFGNTSLLITDTGNNRIVRYDTIPTSNYAPNSALFGQPNNESRDSGNTNDRLDYPMEATYSGGRIYIADSNNERSISLTENDFSTTGQAGSIVGKENFNQGSLGECSGKNLNANYGLEVVKNNNGTYWMVTEADKNRVMIWHRQSQSAGATASYVLGQDNFYSCAQRNPNSEGLNAISSPSGIWSNGEKLIVASQRDRRLLVWNEFPTNTGDQPDFQLGQENEFLGENDPESNAPIQQAYDYPAAVGGNDHQICITDTGLDRVTIWYDLPESNDDLADVVIGQVDFNTQSFNGGTTSQSLRNPKGCDISMEQLFISDSSGNRVLIYNALNKRP